MMKTCESMKHNQIVFDTYDQRECPLCGLHSYVDSLEEELKEYRRKENASFANKEAICGLCGNIHGPQPSILCSKVMMAPEILSQETTSESKGKP